MTKNFSICFLTLVIALMLTLGCGAAGSVNDQVIVIGQNGINDLYGAVNSLGQNAGNAVIYLNGPVSLNQQVEIPSNISGLKSVTLASYTGSPVTVVMGGSVICANGIFSLTKQMLCTGIAGSMEPDNTTYGRMCARYKIATASAVRMIPVVRNDTMLCSTLAIAFRTFFMTSLSGASRPPRAASRFRWGI